LGFHPSDSYQCSGWVAGENPEKEEVKDDYDKDR
jgi:hypothetical protein